MLDKIYERIDMYSVMDDLRKHGARCVILHHTPTKTCVIRAALKNGRLWEINEIKNLDGENKASIVELKPWKQIR